MLTTQIFNVDDTLNGIKVTKNDETGSLTFSVIERAEHNWETDSHFHAHVVSDKHRTQSIREVYQAAVKHLIAKYIQQGFILSPEIVKSMYATWTSMRIIHDIYVDDDLPELDVDSHIVVHVMYCGAVVIWWSPSFEPGAARISRPYFTQSRIEAVKVTGGYAISFRPPQYEPNPFVTHSK